MPRLLRLPIVWVLFVVTLAALFAKFAVLSLFGEPGRRMAVRVARVWDRLFLWTSGVRLQVEGLENLPQGTAIYMVNHRSNLDPLVFVASVPVDTTFMVKKGLMKLPVIGMLLRVVKCIPLERKGDGSDRDKVELAVKSVEAGRTLALFPEGTRSRDDSFLPFKKGGALIAIRTGRPVVPVALSGTNGLMPKDAKMLRPGLVVVRVLPPIETKGLTLDQRDELTEKVLQAIKSAYIPAAELQK